MKLAIVVMLMFCSLLEPHKTQNTWGKHNYSWHLSSCKYALSKLSHMTTMRPIQMMWYEHICDRHRPLSTLKGQTASKSCFDCIKFCVWQHINIEFWAVFLLIIFGNGERFCSCVVKKVNVMKTAFMLENKGTVFNYF